METRQLRYFAEVARRGNLSRAAEAMVVAQPALSQQMKRPETEMGVTLFDRATRPVRLTEAGRALHARVAPILAELELARAEMREFGGLRGAASGSGCGTPSDEHGRCRLQPDRLGESDDIASLPGLVSAGLGVSIVARLPASAPAHRSPSWRSTPRCPAHTAVLAWRGNVGSSAVAALVEVIREHVAELRPPSRRRARPRQPSP